MWWRSLDAARLAPDLLYLVEENGKEIHRLVREAGEKGNAVQVLPYVQLLQQEMKAADRLLERLTDARS